MILSNLHLNNFRNFSAVDLEFSSLTLLLGNNAQGKSNLLESIYFLATTRSLRVERDIQLIRQGESYCRIEGEVDETKLEIAMQVRSEGNFLEKRVKVNGVNRRVIDYLGHLAVVYFSPEDINLVTGSPSLRRSYLDLSLAQADRDYKKALLIYASAVSSRNRLLKRVKEGLSKITELEYWSGQLVSSGGIISSKRQYWFEVLNKELSSLIGQQGLGDFKLSYQQSILSEDRLKEYLPREIASGNSLIGPHRDDFTFELNGQPLAFFGSRGEQRTAVLDLKIAELRYLSQVIESSPILLLDDVFSELDGPHRQQIMTLISGQQTIISAVEGERLPDKLLKSAKIIRIEQGTIVP